MIKGNKPLEFSFCGAFAFAHPVYYISRAVFTNASLARYHVTVRFSADVDCEQEALRTLIHEIYAARPAMSIGRLAIYRDKVPIQIEVLVVQNREIMFHAFRKIQMSCAS